MEKLINYGLEVLNKPTFSTDEKTVVVIGVARSGTSMIANVLDQMGVYLGDQKDKAVFEDVEISKALEQNNISEFKHLIEKRNSKYKIWGWKRPSSFDSIDTILKHVRNPHFVIVFRDPLAISMRNKISMKLDLLENLKQTQEKYLEIIEFIQNTTSPCILISYEKAMFKKLKFIISLGKFLDLNIVQAKALKISESVRADKPLYLANTTTLKIVGSCHLRENTIKGKVRFVHKPNEKVDLLVRVNNKVAKEFTVNPSENEAFEINCKDVIEPNNYAKVELLEKTTSVPVNNSPLLIYNALNKDRQQKLFFVHVPKTGGTTVRHSINKMFNANEVFPNENDIKSNKGQYPPLRSLIDKSNDEIKTIKLLNGHYRSTEYRFLPFKLDILVFFRNPVERVISNIKHFKTYDARCKNMTLEEIYKTRIDVLLNLQLTYVANHLIQNHQLLTLEKNKFIELITQLINQTKFIGITERMNDSITLLNHIFDWNIKPAKSLNKTKSKESVSNELYQIIEKDCTKEKWLYEIAVNMFNTRLTQTN